MKFRARTNDKKQLDVNWDHINVYLSKWKPGTLLDVEIVRHQSKISSPLRSYYFAAVLPPIMSSAGYEKDEILDLHKFMKIRYFNIKPDKWGIYRKKDIPSVFGNESPILVPVKKQFVDYVVRKAAEVGIYIKDPEGG